MLQPTEGFGSVVNICGRCCLKTVKHCVTAAHPYTWISKLIWSVFTYVCMYTCPLLIVSTYYLRVRALAGWMQSYQVSWWGEVDFKSPNEHHNTNSKLNGFPNSVFINSIQVYSETSVSQFKDYLTGWGPSPICSHVYSFVWKLQAQHDEGCPHSMCECLRSFHHPESPHQAR